MTTPLKFDCAICDASFAFDDHQYDGHFIEIWNAYFCNSCHGLARDGFHPDTEKRREFKKRLDLEGRPYQPGKYGPISLPDGD